MRTAGYARFYINKTSEPGTVYFQGLFPYTPLPPLRFTQQAATPNVGFTLKKSTTCNCVICAPDFRSDADHEEAKHPDPVAHPLHVLLLAGRRRGV